MLILSPRPMGATFEPGEQIEYLEKRFPRTLARYATESDFAEKHLGGKTVKELERLATALHFTIEGPRDPVEARAKKIVEAKPHVSAEDATSAVVMIDEWRASIDSQKGAPAEA